MKFSMKIQCDTAAFADDLTGEIGRALTAVADALGEGGTEGNIRDSNGNTVGKWSLKKE
jgi:hypothetical protein